MSTACLHTTVINRSGYTRNFSLLPPHGRRLAPNEQVDIPGDLVTRLSNCPRNFAALETMLANGTLVILSSPAPVFYDATRDETKIIALDDGALGVADPCYGGFSSSAGG